MKHINGADGSRTVWQELKPFDTIPPAHVSATSGDQALPPAVPDSFSKTGQDPQRETGSCDTSSRTSAAREASALILGDEKRTAELKTLWIFDAGDRVCRQPACGPDGTIYVGDDDGTLYALKQGKKLWDFNTRGAIMAKPALHPDGSVIFGSMDNKLYSVKNGNVQWHCDLKGTVQASPLLGPDGTAYIGSSEGYFGVKKGKIIWEFTEGGQFEGASHMDSDGTVYFGSYEHNIHAMKDGREQWRLTLDSYSYNGQAIGRGADNTLYVPGNTTLTAVREGKTLWQFSDKDMPASFTTPATGPDGTIYTGAMNGKLYALKDGRKLWEFDTCDDRHAVIPRSENIKREPVPGPDGTVYFSAGKKVYAVKEGKKLWDFEARWDIEYPPTLGPDGTIYVSSSDHKVYALKYFTLADKMNAALTSGHPDAPAPEAAVSQENGWLIVGGSRIALKADRHE